MRRMQLIEIHDQPWFPAFLRDQVTDALQLILHLGQFYRPILGRLQSAVEAAGSGQVVDLCSGAGGPWLWFYRYFDRSGGKKVSICLTDKYPNIAAFRRAGAASQGTIQTCSEPVDVTKVPPGLSGFRTLFASFHHFAPTEAAAILQDAVDCQEGIAVFEVAGRHALTLLLTLFVPVAGLLVTPFLRPFRWSRLLWTYLIPVVPLVLLLDGVVSCLRVYSPQELDDLTTRIPRAQEYEWQTGEERSGLLPITYLIGCPRSRQSARTRADNPLPSLVSRQVPGPART